MKLPFYVEVFFRFTSTFDSLAIPASCRLRYVLWHLSQQYASETRFVVQGSPRLIFVFREQHRTHTRFLEELLEKKAVLEESVSKRKILLRVTSNWSVSVEKRETRCNPNTDDDGDSERKVMSNSSRTDMYCFNVLSSSVGCFPLILASLEPGRIKKKTLAMSMFLSKKAWKIWGWVFREDCILNRIIPFSSNRTLTREVAGKERLNHEEGRRRFPYN